MEEKCGIHTYYNTATNTRPKVVLKRTPQDFVVNEIRPDGIMCNAGDDYRDASIRPSAKPEYTLDQDALLACGIAKDEAEEIANNLSGTPDGTITLSGVFDKQERTTIHAAFKDHPKLVTDCPEPGKLRVSLKSTASRHSTTPYDHRNSQDRNVLPFVQFTLSKTGCDTMEAVGVVAKAIGGRQVREFSFAGTKDRRAVTHQRVVMRNCNPARLLGVNKVLCNGERTVRVSGVERGEGQLSLGDLAGNRFNINLYSVDGHILQSIPTDGVFVNYFGLQRFGTHAVSTDTIGEAMLRQDYHQACSLIIPTRFPDLRVLFDSGDYAGALSVCPPFLHTERCILEHLAGKPADWEGALMRVPRETRMLYVHAWQSLMFNRGASARMATSTVVVPGDLVLDADDHVILVDDGDKHNYTMFDVVIPLPGHQTHQSHAIKLPDGISFQPKNPAMYDLPGCYRKLLARAEDLVVGQLTDPTGLNLQFTLKPSAYATMFLREHFECVEP